MSMTKAIGAAIRTVTRQGQIIVGALISGVLASCIATGIGPLAGSVPMPVHSQRASWPSQFRF